MRLIYLREETPYKANVLVNIINGQLTSTPEATIKGEKSSSSSSANSDAIPEEESNAFVLRLKKAMDNGLADTDEKTVVKKTIYGCFSFRFIGLFDYVDKDASGTERNLTFFFVPKFVSEDQLQDPSVRDTVLLAIDCYKGNLSQLGNQAEETEKHKEGVLELAVRVLRDYLENDVYTVQRRELEHNGQGEINWETTIDQYQPVFLKGRKGEKPRPVYMDYATELAWADEEHYITRLHQCLVTTWGRKLEELGLSSVLRVNVPLLSEDDLVHFGTKEYQLDQIRKEMGVQFVTKSRHTLSLMKELIERMSESQSANDLSLSFGMNGAEHLWEKACAEVLGSELDEPINKCGFEWDGDVTFRKYMPRPIWTQISRGSSPMEDENPWEQSGWRLDFIRTWPINGSATKLVILDAKYYDFTWDDNDKIQGSLPGIGDIAKQIFYQMAFTDLIDKQKEKPAIVNAFLFPEDDASNRLPLASEIVKLGWKKERKIDPSTGFGNALLFGVRIPGIELLRRYASGEKADKWFEKIVKDEEEARKTLDKLSC